MKRSRKKKDAEAEIAARPKKRRSMGALKHYVWLYFMVEAILILALLWVFQYFYLPKYYRAAKIRDVMSAADQIIQNFNTPDRRAFVRETAFNNNMFVLIKDSEGGDVEYQNSMGSYSFFGKDKDESFGYTLYQMRRQIDDSEKGSITKIFRSDEFGHDEIFYGSKFISGSDEYYLYLESPIEPINSTVRIIREQLIYISVILFELAFIITVLMSRRISRPIEKITETAKKFGDGDFEVEFKAEGYREIEELSGVLDHARDEVKKVTDLKKELIANVSHDLRTPLTMVKAYAEMIRDLSGDNPEKREKHCQIIIDEADRLSALVNSILELSKIESGSAELTISEYSVHSQIEDVLKRYTIMIEKNGYDIRFEPDDDVYIAADHDKLGQVLYNFINNAINYSGEEKHIRVRQVNKSDCVRIEVTDNGQGIPKDKLSQVFDRYYRGGKVKRETVGTGLGLSICKEILKKHEFAFGVASEEGKGSTFWFEAALAPMHPVKPDDTDGTDGSPIDAEIVE